VDSYAALKIRLRGKTKKGNESKNQKEKKREGQ
jgi:hypothetical protein